MQKKGEKEIKRRKEVFDEKPKEVIKNVKQYKDEAKRERAMCKRKLDDIEFLREHPSGFKNLPKERELYYEKVRSIVNFCITKRAFFKNPYHSDKDLPEVMQRGFSAWAKKNNFEFK